MSRSLFATLLFAVSIAQCGYFSDESSSPGNRLYLSGALRGAPSGLGFGYQRKIAEGWSVDGGIGSDALEGLNGSLGVMRLWGDTQRFRPMMAAGLSLSGGVRQTPGDPYTGPGEVETYPGGFVYAYGGFQFRLFGGVGVQYTLGWRQRVYGDDAKVIPGTDTDLVRLGAEALTGTGLLFSGGLFLEY
jgi:hypothetical protein